MRAHVSGIVLASGFYHDLVEPLIELPHAAALLGEGSEVLGYDQSRSADHAFGPRVQIFISEDLAACEKAEQMQLRIEHGLPDSYRGYPVRFFSWQTETVRHHVEITTLRSWLNRQLRMDDWVQLSSAQFSPAKWLSIPQQHLLECTEGAVFRDDLGELKRVREELAWYPKDVWLWMMASEWHLIGNTQHLMGRTIEAGDFRGSMMIAYQMVRWMMELSFLQEKRYWPYLKWFGTAFSTLDAASAIGPLLDTVLEGKSANTREEGVNRVLELLGQQHNALGLTRDVSPRVGDFEVGINRAVRPYPVFNAGEYQTACLDAIEDENLRGLPTIGSIDQLTHSDDLLVNFTRWPKHLERGFLRDLQ